jgi:peptidylprolyl isomerase
MRFISILLFLFSVEVILAQEVKLKVNKEYTSLSGLKINLQKSAKGKLLNKGDKIKVHYTGTLVDGRKFDSSRDKNQPFEFVLGMKQVIAGWDEAFQLLKVGEKATLTVPPDLGYGETPMPNIPEGSYLVFDVEVIDAKRNFIPQPFERKEKQKTLTSTGLEYYIIQQGEGEKAEKGKTVEVHYTGFLENGDVFDSSIIREKPFSFRLGAGMVIPGWDEGISKLNVGGKALLSIPYQLAYGESGRPPLIPPKARLLFNVELISVK